MPETSVRPPYGGPIHSYSIPGPYASCGGPPNSIWRPRTVDFTAYAQIRQLDVQTAATRPAGGDWKPGVGQSGCCWESIELRNGVADSNLVGYFKIVNFYSFYDELSSEHQVLL